MKVYTLIASDYEGSETWKICKNRKKAERLMGQCKRLQKLYKDLQAWEYKSTKAFWDSHTELEDIVRVDEWYKTRDWETYQYWEKQIDNLFKELGTDSFYSQCYIVEKRVE